MTSIIRAVAPLASLLLVACSTEVTRPLPDRARELTQRTPEATSFLGVPLFPMTLDDAVRADREAKLAAARRNFDADPADEDAIIWLGRRLAYLGRYRDAIDVFTAGLARHPDSYLLRRHRGHRYITIRQIDLARTDLDEAAALIRDVPDAVEPDGLPNARNMPTSTSHTNIYYHLGLARYLDGDFAGATDAYRRCLSFAKNADMQCATRYWLYLSLRRQQRTDEAAAVLAPVHADMDIIENVAYHQLLLLYKGVIAPAELAGSDNAPVGAAIENATAAYGLAMYHLLSDRTERAEAMLRAIVASDAWPAFGYIAAEKELARGR